MSIFRTTQKSVGLYSLLGLHHSAIYLISTLASFFQIKKPRFFLVELVGNGQLRLQIMIFGEKGLFQLIKITEQSDNTLSQSPNSGNFAKHHEYPSSSIKYVTLSSNNQGAKSILASNFRFSYYIVTLSCQLCLITFTAYS